MNEIQQQRASRFWHGGTASIDLLAYNGVHVSFVFGYRRLSDLIDDEWEHLNVQGCTVRHNKFYEIPEICGGFVALVQETHCA